MTTYTAVTFAPVQSFIEKSRKLRDLYGSSIILSYLSSRLITAILEHPGTEIVSPGEVNLQKGMPNRILVHGSFPEATAREALLASWANILRHCREWIENALRQYRYAWAEEWKLWANYTWEVFWGTGDSIRSAMEDLEERKLQRAWTAVNWTGESSSLSGTDAAAWPELGQIADVRERRLSAEKAQMQAFYQELARVLEGVQPGGEVQGKFLSDKERLSIPELVKRLVTREDVARSLGIEPLEESFTDIYRLPRDGSKTQQGRWTGWFMGDGDKVGDHLKQLAEQSHEAIGDFSTAMRQWGRQFAEQFPPKLGRVIYAGGDDFLGVLYRPEQAERLAASEALQWLHGFPKRWREHSQDITVSAGFVWAAPSVPQRDVLQHCREAEQTAKRQGRNRVTLRVVFGSGQFVQWTCPWSDLNLLDKYRDRDGRNNWAHIYTDLAQLEVRRAFEPPVSADEEPDYSVALALFNIYFPGQDQHLLNNLKHLVGETTPRALIGWIRDLIRVGWQLCSDTP
ncbi:Cas10/Cmr2 second palm domain-containing protein [Gloeobacter morelensis]|uniref:CRISPR-associated protein Cmr2 n=1 Tax=Gloeobacter morelensis MG652769 TaxID=2781736 RepID=A0ABY3PJ54_9CYAN|nr:type III-B CRISPR-associated protein Cas10/Cmr2 [Gloeobacter morelensis]UFP93588.1 CRISPR-associated protein Cmr2 [Gloeobacter morelensis MG652769]